MCMPLAAQTAEQVLLTSILGKHEITETERGAVLQVIQKREKDCVSKAAVAAGSVNPKYFYGDETQVWAGALSGEMTGGVAQKRLTHDSVFNGEIVMGSARLNSAGDY